MSFDFRAAVEGVVTAAESQGAAPAPFDWIKAKIVTLAGEVAGGVTVTSVGFEGGSGSGSVTTNPKEALAIFQAALERYNATTFALLDADTVHHSRISHVDYRSTPIRT